MCVCCVWEGKARNSSAAALSVQDLHPVSQSPDLYYTHELSSTSVLCFHIVLCAVISCSVIYGYATVHWTGVDGWIMFACCRSFVRSFVRCSFDFDIVGVRSFVGGATSTFFDVCVRSFGVRTNTWTSSQLSVSGPWGARCGSSAVVVVSGNGEAKQFEFERGRRTNACAWGRCIVVLAISLMEVVFAVHSARWAWC